MQQQSADRHVVQLVGQCAECTLTQRSPFLTNRGKRRHGIAAKRNVVESHDTDVLRNAKSKFCTVDHNTVGKDIVTAQEITDVFREIWPDDPCKGDFALFGYGVTH